MHEQGLKFFISNDDGIDAPGIETLCAILGELGECRTVAPDSPQSGVGHAVSDGGAPIKMRTIAPDRHAVGGTPADCARLALAPGSSLMTPEWQAARARGDLWLVAGINHGANLGIDTYVSGTAAAAREAAILGVPAIAISQYVGRHRSIDWERCRARSTGALTRLLEKRPTPGAFWNVNLPHPHDEATRCELVHCRLDPSAQGIRYEREGEHYTYAGDYHSRPRLPGHDIDVCFGGRIAVSEISISA